MLLLKVDFFAFFGSLVSSSSASSEIFEIDKGIPRGVEILTFFVYFATSCGEHAHLMTHQRNAVRINLNVWVGFPGTGVSVVVELGVDDRRVLLAQRQARHLDVLQRVGDTFESIGRTSLLAMKLMLLMKSWSVMFVELSPWSRSVSLLLADSKEITLNISARSSPFSTESMKFRGEFTSSLESMEDSDDPGDLGISANRPE